MEDFNLMFSEGDIICETDPNFKNDKIDILEKEKEELRKQLQEEKLKWLKIEDRFNFLENNYIEFINQKEEYMKLRNEKLSSISEHATKSSQTWDNIICNFCKTTQQLINQETVKKLLKYKNEELVYVKRQDVLDLEEKFNILKSKILEKETYFLQCIEKSRCNSILPLVDDLEP